MTETELERTKIKDREDDRRESEKYAILLQFSCRSWDIINQADAWLWYEDGFCVVFTLFHFLAIAVVFVVIL